MRHLSGFFRPSLLLAVVVAGAGTACVPVQSLFDLLAGNPAVISTPPGETLLTMSRKPGLGWCPYENMLLDVTVVRDVDGRYILTGSKTVESTDPTANCTFQERNFAPVCFVAEDLAPTVLADQDAAELERQLARLPSRICGGFFICDPCRVTELVFADRRETSCCMSNTKYARKFGNIESLLDAIAAQD